MWPKTDCTEPECNGPNLGRKKFSACGRSKPARNGKASYGELKRLERGPSLLCAHSSVAPPNYPQKLDGPDFRSVGACSRVFAATFEGLRVSKTITSLPQDITEPGTYELSESLCLESGEYALKICQPGVTLDLASHTLSAKSGITILLEATDFTLRNGVLKGSSLALVPSPHIRPDRCHLSDLEVDGVLFLGGDHLVVERCTVVGATHGIRAGLHAKISDCEVSGALLGVEVGAGSEVLRTKVTHCEEGVYAYGNREAPVHLELTTRVASSKLKMRLVDTQGQVGQASTEMVVSAGARNRYFTVRIVVLAVFGLIIFGLVSRRSKS